MFADVLARKIDFLAPVIVHVYNRIKESGRWPKQWLTEYVSVIPKGKCPDAITDTRNISCTNYLSKVFERFMLK